VQCQLIDTLGVLFVLKNLFGKADAEAMDTEPAQVQELEGDMMEVYYEAHIVIVTGTGNPPGRWVRVTWVRVPLYP